MRIVPMDGESRWMALYAHVHEVAHVRVLELLVREQVGVLIDRGARDERGQMRETSSTPCLAQFSTLLTTWASRPWSGSSTDTAKKLSAQNILSLWLTFHKGLSVRRAPSRCTALRLHLTWTI